MFEYCIGLQMGRFTNNPTWQVIKEKVVKAESLEEAIKKWVEITNENIKVTLNNEYINEENWNIKLIYSNDSRVVNYKI